MARQAGNRRLEQMENKGGTMRTKESLTAVFILLTLLAAPVAARAADETPGKTLFTTAKEALDRGDYQQALEGFLEAEEAGLSTPALYYNLGVAHYRLGDYGRAKTAFLKAATSPAAT